MPHHWQIKWGYLFGNHFKNCAGAAQMPEASLTSLAYRDKELRCPRIQDTDTDAE